jgi:hypothetical protein
MKRTNLTFGVYPDVSLAHARKLRAEAKELPAKNIKRTLMGYESRGNLSHSQVLYVVDGVGYVAKASKKHKIHL